MKSFKIQFLNKEGDLQETLVKADSESEAKKGVTARQDFDMIICCRSVWLNKVNKKITVLRDCCFLLPKN